MSSTNKTSNYQLSQFVGSDIPSILNDYNGDMRKIDSAIKEVANAEGSSASDIAGLQATVGQHTTEISGINSTVNSLSIRVVGIESKIPANASADNKLITEEDIPEIPSIAELENDVADIKSVIPSNASASNKLATMNDIPSGGSGSITLRGSQFANYNALMAELARQVYALNLSTTQKQNSKIVIGDVYILHCLRGDDRLMEYNDVRYEPQPTYLAIFSNYVSLNSNYNSSYYNGGGIQLAESGNSNYTYHSGSTETPEDVTFYY